MQSQVICINETQREDFIHQDHILEDIHLPTAGIITAKSVQIQTETIKELHDSKHI